MQCVLWYQAQLSQPKRGSHQKDTPDRKKDKEKLYEAKKNIQPTPENTENWNLSQHHKYVYKEESFFFLALFCKTFPRSSTLHKWTHTKFLFNFHTKCWRKVEESFRFLIDYVKTANFPFLHMMISKTHFRFSKYNHI